MLRVPACQALPLAIAAVRDASGASPPEAAELLLEVADGDDNRGNPYDDASLSAALVEALGSLRLRSPEVPCFSHTLFAWMRCGRRQCVSSDGIAWAITIGFA